MDIFLKTPFLLPAAAIVCGILAGTAGAGQVCGFIAILTGAVICLGLTRRKSTPGAMMRTEWMHFCWIFFIMFGIGLVRVDFDRTSIPEILSGGGPVRLVGSVAERLTTTSGDRLLLDLESVMVANGRLQPVRNCRMYLYTDDVGAAVGDVVYFDCTPVKAGVSANFRDNGYERMLRQKKIFFSGRSDGDGVVVSEGRFSLKGLAASLRSDFVRTIELTGFDKRTTDFLVTVLTGDREYLDPETRKVFAASGVAHALALSGLHIGIVAAILLFIFFPLNFAGRYKWRLFLTVVAVWGYTVVTGLSPSTVRAAVMATFLFTAMILERHTNSFNSLCASVFFILLFTPGAVTDAGFQMSVASVAVIIAFVEPLNPVGWVGHKKFHDAVSVLLCTLVASVGLWVLTAYYFGKVPLLFIPSNLILLPLLPLFISVSIVCVLLSGCGVSWVWLTRIIDGMFGLAHKFLEFLSDGEGGVLQLSVSGYTIFLWFAALVLCAWYVHRGGGMKMLWGAASLGVAAVISVLFVMDVDGRDGFIFQSRYDRVSVMCYEGEGERLLTPPDYCVTGYEVCGRKILVLDSDISGLPATSADYVIISRGFSGSVSEIKDVLGSVTIVIHPSVFRKNESRLIDEARSLGLKTHSLRNDGPLQVWL